MKLFSLFRTSIIGLILLTLSAPSWSMTRSVCVFDPIGKSGDIFATATDLSMQFMTLGVNLKLKLYLDESKARKDFEARRCDAVLLTGLQARRFNTFVATVEAPGMFLNYDNLPKILGIMASEKASKYMRKGNVEVAGVYPAGFVYMVLNDKKRAHPNKLRGLKMINIDNNIMISDFAKRVGGTTVPATTNTFVKLFKERTVDVTFAPMAIFSALELDVALDESQGAIMSLPIALLTIQVLIHADRFPEGYGQSTREMSLLHYERVLDISKRAEKNVQSKYWLNGFHNMTEWEEVAYATRRSMLDKGFFSPKMIKIINKFRCEDYRMTLGCD